MGHSSLQCLFLCHELFLTSQLVTAACFHTFCLRKPVSSAAGLAQSIGFYFLPASSSSSFYPFRRFLKSPHCGKTMKVFKIFQKKWWSCGTSSPAVSLSERRVCQPAVCSGMTYTTKARPNEVLGSSPLYIESSIMFRKYFIILCGVGDVSICPSNWSWDVMTLYITKDN